jgi:WD40 repeat protein
VSSVTIALEQFTTFGDLLKYLRRRAGLTQRELSIAVGYSIPQISRLEQNQRLPDLATLTARFLPVLDLESEPVAAARLLALATAVRREDAPGPGLPPFKGLLYFDESDAELFFGRQALVDKLVARVNSLPIGQITADVRFLAVVGASGSGKSSLVRAGLIPVLRWQTASAGWPVVVLTPTVHPLEALAAGLTREAQPGQAPADLAAELASDPQALHRLVSRIVPAPPAFLLVVDQFEELFTLCRSEAEQTAFVDNLLTAANEPAGAAIVVIALRADFYAQCARFASLRECLALRQEYIGPMNSAELRQAIEAPARRGHWELETGLVEVLLKDVGAGAGHSPEPGALPLLSHALLETWLRRRGQTLTLSGYLASGGVRGAIAETAEAVFQDQLDLPQRAIARQIFLRLTELGAEGVTADTRRRAAFSELIPEGSIAPAAGMAVRDVLQTLADARLITTEADGAEVAHEALIREWPTLRGWLEEDREGLRLHRQITEAAQAWVKLERDPGSLYRGARLAQALEWLADLGNASALNALEHEFLAASKVGAEREAAEREAARQRELQSAQQVAEAQQQRAESQARAARQLRRRAVYLLGALVLAVTAALAAVVFGQRANHNLAVAQAAQATAQSDNRARATQQSVAESNFARAEAQRLAAEANNLLNVSGNTELIALLAIRSINTEYTFQGDAALQAAATLDYPLLSFATGGSNIYLTTVSPDGRYVLTESPNDEPAITSTVRLWDAQTGALLQSIPFATGFSNMAFTPDSQAIFINQPTDPDNTGHSQAELWDIQRQQITQKFTTPSCSAAPIWLNNATLVLGCDDGTLWSLDLTTGQQQLMMQTTGLVQSISPHAKFAVITGAGGLDTSIQLWDMGGATTTLTITNTAGIGAVAFSPDDSQIAVGFGDGSIGVWQTTNGQQLGQFDGHTNNIDSLFFSPDGQYVLSGSDDRTVRLWDATTRRELRRFTFGNIANAGGFSSDSQKLLTGGQDGVARLWSIVPQPEWPVLRGHTAYAVGTAFSPDGRTVAAGGNDNTIRLWDIHTGQTLRTFQLDGSVNYGLRFSPDGAHLLAGTHPGTIYLWDAATGAQLWQVHSPALAVVHSVAFSPDGRLFAAAGRADSASSGTYVVLGDAASGALVQTISLPTGTKKAYGVDFAPDGRSLIVAAEDASSYQVSLPSGQVMKTFSGHSSGLNQAHFSPDGRTLVTASLDSTARLWDTQTGQALRDFVGHSASVWNAAFSPDGRLVATGSGDGTMRLWDVATGQELRQYAADSRSVEYLAWSPDGKLLASSGDDKTTKLWDVDYHTTIAYLCGRLQRDLTDAERAQYNITNQAPTCGK